MKSSNLHHNLSQGNVSDIPLNEDREKLLLKLLDLEESIIQTENSLKKLDQKNPIIRKTADKFLRLKADRKQIVSDVIAGVDEKILINSNEKMRLLFERMEKMQNLFNHLQNIVKIQERRLRNIEQEMQTWNLTEEGFNKVLSTIQIQLTAHDRRITMNENDIEIVAMDLNQSCESVRSLSSCLNELGLCQDDFDRVISILKSEVRETQDQLKLTDREMKDWSIQLHLREAEMETLNECFDRLKVQIGEEGKNKLLEELVERVSANERAIDGMLSTLGIHENDMVELKEVMRENELTKGDLLELIPFVNTLKTIISHQKTTEDPAEMPLLQDLYKRSLFNTLRRELNGTYLASSCVKLDLVKNNMKGKMGKVGSILSSIAGSIPMIGGGIQFLGLVLSKVDEIHQSQYVERYCRVSMSAGDMDVISKAIALRLLEDDFDKSVLVDSESIWKEIIGKLFDVGVSLIEGENIKAAVFDSMMTEGSELVAEKVVDVTKRFISRLNPFRSKNKSAKESIESQQNGDNLEGDDCHIANGEKHGNVLSSLIINQIFVGEVTTEGCSNWREFVERVVRMVFSHFKLSYDDQQQSPVGGVINDYQSQSCDGGANRLKILSEIISRGVIEKLNQVGSVLNEKDFSRILRTSHLELLKSVSESQDLKDDLIDELFNDLADISVTPKTLRVTLDESLQRVTGVLRERTYDRDDGTGCVSL